MITEWNIYLLTRLDYLQGLAIGLAVVTSVISLLVCVFGHMDNNQGMLKAFYWKLLPLALVCLFASVLVPNTKEYAAIKVIPAIAANEDVQDVGSEILDLGRSWLEELQPQDKE